MPSPPSVTAIGYSTGSARGANHRTANHPASETTVNTSP